MRWSSSPIVLTILIGLSVSDARAQDSDPAIDQPLDVTLPSEWQPADGRPPWSKAPDAVTATISDWQPGDGKPPWAKALQDDVTSESLTGRPAWAGRPEWADRNSDSRQLGTARRLEAMSNQFDRGAVARGIGNRGRGRR
jgi:hypothetical protein